MLDDIIISEKQSKAIAQSIYGDIRKYWDTSPNRFFLWMVNEIPLKDYKGPRLIMEPITIQYNPCKGVTIMNFKWREAIIDEDGNYIYVDN